MSKISNWIRIRFRRKSVPTGNPKRNHIWAACIVSGRLWPNLKQAVNISLVKSELKAALQATDELHFPFPVCVLSVSLVSLISKLFYGLRSTTSKDKRLMEAGGFWVGVTLSEAAWRAVSFPVLNRQGQPFCALCLLCLHYSTFLRAWLRGRRQ